MPGPTAGLNKRQRRKAKRRGKRPGITAVGAVASVRQGRKVKPTDFTPRARKAIARDTRRLRRSSSILSEIGPKIEGPLTPKQKQFAAEVAKQTGLSPRVIAAQVLAEMSGSAAEGRDAEGYYNYLNIGHTDSGNIALTKDPRWRDLKTAARLTADFYKGKRFGPSEGIRRIITTRGQSDEAQMQAITSSGWASSNYGGRLQTYGSVSARPGNSPKAKAAQRSAGKAKARLAKRGLAPKGAGGGGVKPLPGPYAGAQAMVRRIVGAPVRGDKEPGHASGGMHDPANPDAYAQDIQLGSSNPAENEPVYDQRLLNRIAGNIRKMGGSVGKIKPGQGMIRANVRGYEIEIIPDSQTNFHGSGPHLHIGAEWKGPGATDGSSVTGGYTLGSVSGSGSGSGKVTFGDNTLTGAERRARRVRREARGRRLADTGSAFSARSSSLGPSSSLQRRYGNPVV